MKYDLDQCLKTGIDYWTRFWRFRAIENRCLTETGDPTVAEEAWKLLSDLESAYAARSYSACFCLACAMIEIHLRRVSGLKGDLSRMLRKVELFSELQWLVKLRNDVMHGNPNPFIVYSPHAEKRDELERLCEKAFMAVHTIADRAPKSAP